MSKYESLAKDIYNWCKLRDLWDDNTIYFDGKAWSKSDNWGGVKGKKIAEDLYEYDDKDPSTYFEYANSKTLSMSFEGGLYSVLNCYVLGWSKLEAEFLKLFEKYDCYYEMGNSWNLSVYKI